MEIQNGLNLALDPASTISGMVICLISQLIILGALKFKEILKGGSI